VTLCIFVTSPEAEQVERRASNFLNGIKIEDVPGVTVNRYCASGLETIGMATKIQSGMAHCVQVVQSMSSSRWVVTRIMLLQKQKRDYWGMGLTAEAVAQQFKVLETR
jgi:acetyl-CoA acyltransferase